jgi:tyrosyl-tRNA synthetase
MDARDAETVGTSETGDAAPLFEPEILEQAARLKRGTQQIVPKFGLEEKLARSARTGVPLRIKLGLDPTAPDIHIGFAVVLRKLRQFQDMGHQVVVIIGDYTALIGDPSGRSATRPMLSQQEIRENATTYVAQLTRILDAERTVVRFNGEWLGALTFAELVRLASKMTVAQVLQRDDFANRYAQHIPIGLHELLYPLAQAYDSVAIEADIEMGGQDQTFNILAGRDLQREEGQDPQAALFMPILVGLDGVKKMSKSLGNYVGIAETPDVMFGKLMSISDEMLRSYFELCSDVEMDCVDALMALAGLMAGEIDAGARARALILIGAAPEIASLNPKDVKRLLAREIVAIYHGAAAAKAADGEWQRVHSQHEVPADMPEFRITADLVAEGGVWICRLLVACGIAKGTGEARRLVEQGGVSINGRKIADTAAELPLASLADAVLKVGAKRFVRLRTP